MLHNGDGYCPICQQHIEEYEIPPQCTGECGCAAELVPAYSIPAEVELDFNKDTLLPPQPVDYVLDTYEDNPLDEDEDMWFGFDEEDNYE